MNSNKSKTALFFGLVFITIVVLGLTSYFLCKSALTTVENRFIEKIKTQIIDEEDDNLHKVMRVCDKFVQKGFFAIQRIIENDEPILRTIITNEDHDILIQRNYALNELYKQNMSCDDHLLFGGESKIQHELHWENDKKNFESDLTKIEIPFFYTLARNFISTNYDESVKFQKSFQEKIISLVDLENTNALIILSVFVKNDEIEMFYKTDDQHDKLQCEKFKFKVSEKAGFDARNLLLAELRGMCTVSRPESGIEETEGMDTVDLKKK